MKSSEEKIFVEIKQMYCYSAIHKIVFAFVFLCTLLISLFYSQKLIAQNISATLKADSTHILIGDFLNLKLNINFSNDLIVSMPKVTDSIGHMELVKASTIDTSINNNSTTLSQSFIVSAYDSGNYFAGPQKIYFKTKSGAIDSLITDSILITVRTIAVDTSKAFKPIKPPLEVPYSWQEFIPLYIGGFILVASIIALILYVRYRRKNRKPKIIERPKPKDLPHVWARRELKKLEEEKLWQQDEVKKYYSRLTDILRLYLEYRFNWLALESTTEEIKEQINSYSMNVEAKNLLLKMLSNADMVKFAKIIPAPATNIKSVESAFHFIDLTEQKDLKTEEKINV
ncbi:MAG: hypothetical protein LH473_10830 [Chitinophagales bacterium]|nr:hypothetical protein [Chitinophagales bacterium]